MLSSDKSSSRREAWDAVVKNLLDEVLQRAFHQTHNPVLSKGQFQCNLAFRTDLQKGVDEVNKKLKDPFKGSKAGDINVNVPDVADLEVGQLQSSTVGNVHLEMKIEIAQKNF